MENYVNQWQAAVDDYALNFYVRHPEYLDALPETERLAISNTLSGVRQYSEMPLKILKAQELVGGEEAMDQILKSLFTRELDPMYPYLTYQDVLDACGLPEEARYPRLGHPPDAANPTCRVPFRLRPFRP